jgi:RNA polymerase sigma factor (sigma-70 family)
VYNESDIKNLISSIPGLPLKDLRGFEALQSVRVGLVDLLTAAQRRPVRRSQALRMTEALQLQNRLRNALVTRHWGVMRFASSCDRILTLIQCIECYNPWSGWSFCNYAIQFIRHSLREKREHPTSSYCDECGDGDSVGRAGEQEVDAADAVAMALVGLDPRERSILKARFGLDGRGERTLREVGNQHNLSAERVRTIESQCLAKIRKRMTSSCSG